MMCITGEVGIMNVPLIEGEKDLICIQKPQRVKDEDFFNILEMVYMTNT